MDVDNPAMIDAFVSAIPIRLQAYSANCIPAEASSPVEKIENKPVDSTERPTGEKTEDKAVEQDSADATVSPTTATISAFTAFADKAGNQGLNASKFAKAGAHTVEKPYQESVIEKFRSQAAKNAVVESAPGAETEDRENATFFASWGAPEARSTPKAEKRRVVITGLSASIENSYLTSLIHEGPLETCRIVKTEGAAVGSVTFTTGASAKLFYDKHPNGLVVKINGKKHVATVEMGENVDVISGVMRGYLDVGATRVVRVTGAEEDWTARALKNLAEDKGRKLEAIADIYQEASRTVDFTFTNIADAVAFRGFLTKNHDWEDAVVTFGADPCAQVKN